MENSNESQHVIVDSSMIQEKGFDNEKVPYDKEFSGGNFIYELEINENSDASSENRDITVGAATKISFFPPTQSLAEPEHEPEYTVDFATTKKNVN
jgi:hypothetical protein